jgi:hypothetical protein
MSYQITIKQVTREQVKSREWKQTGTKDADDEPEYGYVTEEKTEDVERTVYTQRVYDLDIKQVIDAVNAKTYNPAGQLPVAEKGQADGTQS